MSFTITSSDINDVTKFAAFNCEIAKEHDKAKNRKIDCQIAVWKGRYLYFISSEKNNMWQKVTYIFQQVIFSILKFIRLLDDSTKSVERLKEFSQQTVEKLTTDWEQKALEYQKKAQQAEQDYQSLESENQAKEKTIESLKQQIEQMKKQLEPATSDVQKAIVNT